MLNKIRNVRFTARMVSHDQDKNGGATSLYLEPCLGGSFRELSARLKEENKWFSLKQVATHFGQMVIAIEDLQACNIISRDIKPDNYVLTHTGDIRMIDFGIAVELEGGKPKTGLATGTKSWRSPEAVKSDRRPDGTRPNTLLGFPADIRGLGSMLRWQCVGKSKRLNEFSPRDRRMQINMFKNGSRDNKTLIPNLNMSDLKLLNNLCQKLLATPQIRTKTFAEIWEHPFLKKFGGKAFREKLIHGQAVHDQDALKAIKSNVKYMLIGAGTDIRKHFGIVSKKRRSFKAPRKRRKSAQPKRKKVTKKTPKRPRRKTTWRG